MGAEPEVEEQRWVRVAEVALGEADHQAGGGVAEAGELEAVNVRAPGRLELLGNHTDYNEGLVMSLAVDRYIHMASAPRLDGKIELVSAAFPERELFWMSDLKKNPTAPWADYVKGVLDQLRKRGVDIQKHEFNYALNSVSEERADDLSDAISAPIVTSSRKAPVIARTVGQKNYVEAIEK